MQNFKDIESLAKTVVHQQKVLGSRIPLPKNDDEYNELYNKLGRPEDPNKYEVKIPQEYEQYFKKENVDEFKNVAHKIGLNNKQVNALLDYQVNSIKYEMQNEPASIVMEKDKTEQMLKQEWGYDYDKNVRAATRALDVYGDDELKDLLNN